MDTRAGRLIGGPYADRFGIRGRQRAGDDGGAGSPNTGPDGVPPKTGSPYTSLLLMAGVFVVMYVVLLRAFEVLRGELRVSHRGERYRTSPWGLRGGSAGASCLSVLHRAGGTGVNIPSKVDFVLRPGDFLDFSTTGGGGWGGGRREGGGGRRETGDGRLRAEVATITSEYLARPGHLFSYPAGWVVAADTMRSVVATILCHTPFGAIVITPGLS